MKFILILLALNLNSGISSINSLEESINFNKIGFKSIETQYIQLNKKINELTIKFTDSKKRLEQFEKKYQDDNEKLKKQNEGKKLWIKKNFHSF
jgi:hypothetical protein